MNMKLELAKFPVRDAHFDKKTGYKNGVLEINKEELLALVLEDERIASADLDMAFPGEQTRIVYVRDAVEPRVKVSGPGCVFPGILGRVETVGEGRTHTLPGVTVVTSAQYRPEITSGTDAGAAALVDMWGPGAQMSPFGSTINLALILKLADSATELDAHSAIQLAEFKVGNRLAEATRDMTSGNIEVFELPEVDSSLPRVVYVLAAMTMSYPHTGVIYYGLPIDTSLPTFVHPNEFLDGALTTDCRKGSGIGTPMTWGWMNQPVILELLREHGKRLNFLGVILERTRFTSEIGKKIAATATAQMARLLGADASIITGMVPSGNNFMDVMFTVGACEKKEVKTVLITAEWGADEEEIALPFYVPEATAMVSTGVFGRDLKLPAPAKVIGVREGELATCQQGEPQYSPWGDLEFDSRFVLPYGGIDWWGDMNFACKEY